MSQVRFLEDFGSYARYLCRMILKLVFLCLKLLTTVFSKFLIGNLSMSEVTFSGFCKLHIGNFLHLPHFLWKLLTSISANVMEFACCCKILPKRWRLDHRFLPTAENWNAVTKVILWLTNLQAICLSFSLIFFLCLKFAKLYSLDYSE